MSTYDDLFNRIMALPVFDTHTHLESGYRQPHKGLYARSFFDVCDYFWFRRELNAVGYRKGAGVDPASPDAARALHDSLRGIRNTAWTRTVMQAMEDLFGIRPDSPARILELSEVMSKSVENRQWGLQVCDRIGIRKTVMGLGGGPEGTLVDVDVLGDRIVRVPLFRLAGKFVPGYDENDPELYLVKTMMARFFHDQIEKGWLDDDAALFTARHWLHDTAETLYLPKEKIRKEQINGGKST